MPSFDRLMKKSAILIFVLGFLVGLVLWIGARVALLDFIHLPERAMWLAKARMLATYHYRAGDVIIIGSSRALAISPEQLQQQYGVRAVNFSVGGATTPSTYFFLKRILKNNPGIRKVYLEFAPINMSAKDTALNASLGENFIRYVATEQESQELDEDLPGARELYHAVHVFPFPKYVNMKDLSLLEGLLVRWRTGNSDEADMRRIVGHRGFLLYPGTKIRGEAQNRAFEKRANEYYGLIDSYTKELPSVTDVYFEKIIGLLNDRNIDYHIFFSPVPCAGLRFKHVAFGKTYNLFKRVDKKINNHIPVFDNEYFSEPSHVDKDGSILFTNYFYECIMNDKCDSHNTVSIF
jgi:hypothetical protein